MISSFSDIDYDYDYEIDLLCSFYLILLAVMIPSLQISIQVGLLLLRSESRILTVICLQ